MFLAISWKTYSLVHPRIALHISHKPITIWCQLIVAPPVWPNNEGSEFSGTTAKLYNDASLALINMNGHIDSHDASLAYTESRHPRGFKQLTCEVGGASPQIDINHCFVVRVS